MSLSITDFPKEVLDLIFSFLRVPDKLNVSLVCKRWLDVMNSKSLLRDIKILINDNNTVPVFIKMSRNFLSFGFRFIIVDNKYYGLFKRFCHHVEFLSFENCEIWKREPVKFDLTYENLNHLAVIDCDLWLLFTSLPNLSELYLSGRSTISDDGIACLQKTMKQLKTLTLDCHVAVDPKAYKRFYCRGISYEQQPSSSILSLPAIKSFISERARTLSELNFYFGISSKALKEITSLENLCLTKICLGQCYECELSLSDLFKRQPSLKMVEFSGLKNLNDSVICSLCALLPNVEEISFHNCDVSDDSLSKLFYLKNLKKLDVGKNYGHYSAFINVDTNIASVQLQSLDLSRISLENIDVLIKQCKCLLHLDLSYCNITDEEVHVITENLIHLQYLNLKGNDITDYGVTGLEITEQDQNEIDIENIYEENSKSLSNLKQLKTLKLNACDKITNFGIVQAVRFQYLERLYIIGCHFSRRTLGLLLKQNPSIKKIYCDDDQMQHPKIATRSRRRGLLGFDGNDFDEDQFVFADSTDDHAVHIY